MSGEFDVVSADLTRAADRVRQAVAPVSHYTVESTGADAAAFGHDELAEVLVKFCAKASQVVSQAAAGDQHAAGELDASAAAYDGTDTGSGVLFSGLRPTSAPFASPAGGSR